MWGRGRGIAAEVRACAVDELRIGSAMIVCVFRKDSNRSVSLCVVFKNIQGHMVLLLPSCSRSSKGGSNKCKQS